MNDPWPHMLSMAVGGMSTAGREADSSATGLLAKAWLLHRGAASFRQASGRPLAPPQRDRRAICPQVVVPFLGAIVRTPLFHGVLPEFLALAERRGWRLPPEWLPQVLDVVVSEKILTPAIRRALGTVAQWLAAQEPRWAGFFPQRPGKRQTRALVPPKGAALRIYWPELSRHLWERSVLYLAQEKEAWLAPNSPLVSAVSQSNHPWPDRLLERWLAVWKGFLTRQPHQAPKHFQRLMRVVALRASPERLLAALQECTAQPYAWDEHIRQMRDVAAFRARMYEGFLNG